MFFLQMLEFYSVKHVSEPDACQTAFKPNATAFFTKLFQAGALFHQFRNQGICQAFYSKVLSNNCFTQIFNAALKLVFATKPG